MGFVVSFMKYTLFVFNLVVGLLGLAIMGVGIAAKFKWVWVTELLPPYLSVSIFFIPLGVVIFAIAFFGFCGAIRKNNCMMITYLIPLVVVIIMHVTIGVLIFKESKELIDNSVITLFKKRSASVNDKVLYNSIEIQLGCCGISGPGDYKNGTNGLPNSCCFTSNVTNELVDDECTIAKANVDGCLTVILNYATILGKVSFGVAGIAFLNAVFALCLICHIKERKKSSRF